MGCLAHARRYFHEALDIDQSKPEYVIRIFRQIFAVERSWKELHVEMIYANRQEYLNPLLEPLKTWCEQQALTKLPKSKIGKADRYYLNQNHKLIVVTEHEKLEVDNNLIENKIQPLALGRKNYLFAGSHESAQRIAMMYSFFATCKANTINPTEND